MLPQAQVHTDLITLRALYFLLCSLPQIKPAERTTTDTPGVPLPFVHARLSFPHLTRDNPNMMPRRRHTQSERLRTFRLAGHTVRRGKEDDTTAVPALIPIPRGFGVSEVRRHGQYATRGSDSPASCCGR